MRRKGEEVGLRVVGEIVARDRLRGGLGVRYETSPNLGRGRGEREREGRRRAS